MPVITAQTLDELGDLVRRGADASLWPGLATRRFTEAAQPDWRGLGPLTVGVVLQHRGSLTESGGRLICGQAGYLVTAGRRGIDLRVHAATPERPVLGLFVAIDPQLVRSVSATMHGWPVTGPPVHDPEPCNTSVLDQELADTVLRFLRSLAVHGDRRVLTPLYLQELVYRILQRDRQAHLLALATREEANTPVAAALDYIAAHLDAPLSVETLAAEVCLSPSAFSRLFRDLTGSSPYQYVKDARLDRARGLLRERRHAVAHVARTVGYVSVSHFIKEFRGRYGVTPGEFAAQAWRPGARFGESCSDSVA